MRIARTGLIIYLIALLAGCAATKQHKKVEFSGFLDDYTILEPGEGKYQPAYRYMKPGLDLSKYDAIILEPVQIWRTEAEIKRGTPEEDMQRLADRFYSLLYERLTQSNVVNQKRTANTLRIEVAITSVGRGNEALDVVSTVVPVGWVASAAQEKFTGKPSFVGEVSVEFEFLDAATNEILVAGVDRRSGGKTLGKKMESWADVKRILLLWSDLMAYRICMHSDRVDCVAPKGL